jgi:hypothetical protein
MIRPMTKCEIRAGLRQAAVVCIEKQDAEWQSIDVCRADGTFDAANELAGTFAPFDCPEDAATFLLLCAEAQ